MTGGNRTGGSDDGGGIVSEREGEGWNDQTPRPATGDNGAKEVTSIDITPHKNSQNMHVGFIAGTCHDRANL